MKNQPSSDSGKFPKTIMLIGTSCAGKTTMAYALTSRLKQYGVLAAGVFDQDRKFSFPIERIASEEAQTWMITNIIAKECDIGLHNDVDVLVMDRSPLCLLAYYGVQYSNTYLYQTMVNLVCAWLLKNEREIYYLEPLPYQDDGKRPDDDFRMQVDAALISLMTSFEKRGVKFKRVERHKILEDVLLSLNIKKPGVKDSLTQEDVQAFCNAMGLPILMKPRRADADVFTDDDLWLLVDSSTPERWSDLATNAKFLLRSTVGPYVQFDMNVASMDSVAQLPQGRIFYPENSKWTTPV